MTRDPILQQGAMEHLRTIRLRFPEQYEQLLRAVEAGDIQRARLGLRSLSKLYEEAYVEPMLAELRTQLAEANFVYQDALASHPEGIQILLRSGNRSEAVELYQAQTGVSWSEALAAIQELERQLAARQ